MLRLYDKAARFSEHLSLFHVAKPSPSFSNLASFIERALSNRDFVGEGDQ